MVVGVLRSTHRTAFCTVTLISILLALSAGPSLAGGGPRDVLVVINQNSQISREIGRYYQAARGIPESNICSINCPDQEVVTGEVCESRIREPIRQFLRKSSVAGRIHYVVLTKGVPLSADYGRPASSGPYSVASILTAVDHPDIQEWFEFPYGPNAYYRWGALAPETAWSHSLSFRDKTSLKYYSFYLVTRLDAFSVDQVRAMIDRSCSPAPDGSFVLDKSGQAICNTGNYKAANNRLGTTLATAYDTLVKRGCDVQFDGGSDFLSNLDGIMGYFSWAQHDDHYTFQKYTSNGFVPGSIGDSYNSSSAQTFDLETAGSGPLMADLISCGLCAAGGYVSEPQITTSTYANILFDRYTKGYNMAESFFAACPDGFWKTVIIGDPLMAAYASPPEVSLSLPSLTLNGTQAVTARATDDSGVSKVVFYIDDTCVGTATESPFTVAIDTNEFAIGPHTLQAIAYENSPVATQGFVSEQITVDNPVSTVQSIDDARLYADGQFVRIRGKVVTASTREIGDGFYMEEPDRFSAVKVVTSQVVNRGDVVTIVGAMNSVGGGRVVDSVSLDSRVPGDVVPGPLGLRMCDLGGAPVGENCVAVGRGVGPSNAALLVRCVGKVTSASVGEFCFTDRSVASPLRVVCPGVVPPAVGSWVGVTGLCEVQPEGARFVARLRTRDANDVQVF